MTPPVVDPVDYLKAHHITGRMRNNSDGSAAILLELSTFSDGDATPKRETSSKR